MTTFNNAKEIVKAGFSIEKSIEGQYRLMYDTKVIFEDPANEDMYDYDMAVEYFKEPAAEYINNIEKYLYCIVDMGAGAEIAETMEMAKDVYELECQFGSTEYGADHENFEDTCSRLNLDPAKDNVKKVYWIGGNVCACYCLAGDWEPEL